MPRLRLVGAVAALALAGCGDSGEESFGGGGQSAPGGNGSGASDTGAGSQGGAGEGGSGAGSQGGAPPCSADTLGEAVRITAITTDAATPGRAITAEAGSGSVVAWVGADGIHITPLDAVDQRAGDDLVVEGTQVFGVAASADDVAVLISRAPDFMTFVRLDMTGAELARTDLVGGGDHATIGVEWFGEFAQTGRLAGLPDGTYAAYHALHRRWPDNIGHQGDTLRLLGADGSPLGGGWDWGCSHSMDQRLAVGPNGVVPICIADCYPGKGIYFNHSAAMITPDPAANCAGGFTTLLGGLVASASGFALVYQDASAANHLGLFDTAGQPLSDRTLTMEGGSSRLASYADGFLLGYAVADAGTTLRRLDASGQDAGDLALVSSAPLPENDFESRSNGEVSWAATNGTTLTVVRVRVCE